MTRSASPVKRQQIKYELSMAVWIPGIRLPFRLKATTGDLKLLWARVQYFLREVRRAAARDQS